MTKRESILSAFVSALAPTVGVSGRVFRSRQEAMTREEAPSIIVQPEQEQPTEETIGQIDARLTVSVAVYHRGEQPDALADSVIESAHQLIMQNTTLGGLAVDLTEGETSWEFDEADQPAVLVTMRFVVWYRHNRTSLT